MSRAVLRIDSEYVRSEVEQISDIIRYHGHCVIDFIYQTQDDIYFINEATWAGWHLHPEPEWAVIYDFPILRTISLLTPDDAKSLHEDVLPCTLLELLTVRAPALMKYFDPDQIEWKPPCLK